MIELAFLRNRLSNGIWRSEDEELLLAVRAEVTSTSSPFRAIALNAIDNALEDVNASRYAQARLELNFIHNLDLERGFKDAWNELYFFGAYVSTYLSDVQDLDRAHRLLVLLGDAVSSQEQDPEYQLRRRRDRSFGPVWRYEGSEPVRWVGGPPGVDLEGREKYAMKTYDGDVIWEIAVYWEPAGYHKPAWMGWPEVGVLLLGGGQELYVLDLDTGAVRCHQVLDNYFLKLAFTPDRTRALIVDGTSIAALGASLREIWRTPVAADGVIVDEVDDDHIRIQVEKDPPGQWVPLVLDAHTGQITDPSSTPHGRAEDGLE